MELSQTAPVLERLLRLMAEKKGSDLYLSPGSKVMMKRSGTLVAIGEQSLEPSGPAKLLSTMLPREQMLTLERQGELNTSISVSGAGRFRLSGFKQRGSLAAVFRYIPSNVPTLAESNLPLVLGNLILERRGLILVCGATGSGKSTTIAAMLQERNEKMPGHILTVEDPIEFLFRSKRSIVSQREVGADCENLRVALKNALRQSPDCIFIGEIRDVDTMQNAIAFAQSGHLCVSTLHASNAYQGLTRIVNFFPPEVRQVVLSDLAVTLKSIVSQRLARTPSGARIPVNEVLINTPLISDLINKGELTSVSDAIEKSLTVGSQTYEQAIAALILSGRITRDEGMNLADSPSNLAWRLSNTNPVGVAEAGGGGPPPSPGAPGRPAAAQPLNSDPHDSGEIGDVDFSAIKLGA